MRFKYRAIPDFRSYVREDVFTKRPQLRPNLTVVLDFLRELKERILKKSFSDVVSEALHL